MLLQAEIIVRNTTNLVYCSEKALIKFIIAINLQTIMFFTAGLMRQEKGCRGNFLYLLVIYTVVQEYIVEMLSYGLQVFHKERDV